VSKARIAKHATEPILAKRPKYKDPEIDGKPLAWRFSSCDKEGDFAWTNLMHGSQYKNVIERLHEFEKMKWDQIIFTRSHPIALNKCIKEARKRLSDIEQDDIDELMSFRITGKERVWCIRDMNIMRVLWWDPKHAICPSEKKHT
jgi:hypothetical protein